MNAIHPHREAAAPAPLTLDALRLELASARSDWLQLSQAGLPRLAVPAGVIVLEMQTRLLRLLRQAAAWEADGVQVM